MATRFPQVGDTFGPYPILAQLGQGHAGVVFRSTRDGVEVALKVIRPSQAEQPGFRDAFLRACGDVAALGAPHVAEILDVGEQQGRLYVVTELVPGGDLGARLSGGGALPVDLAGILVDQIADALAHAHAAGIVHGNLKPSNVLLGERDGQPHALLTDFGIVPAATVLGVNSYLAPERLDGSVATPAADLYSLGCLLVAGVTGLAPYQGNDAEVAEQHRERAVPSWEETGAVQARLNHLVRRSMAKDPADRYASADEFRAELRADEPELAGAASGGGKALLVSGIILALVAGAVAGVVVLGKHDTSNKNNGPAAGTPSATPGDGQARTCQEGSRQVAAGQRCGQPYGLPGLRFVFPDITDSCIGSRLNTDLYWQYECVEGGATIHYSTYKTNPIAASHNQAAYAKAPTSIGNGLLRYGPEKRADGTYQESLVYDGTHPYGAEVTAPSESEVRRVADGLAIRPPSEFRGD